MNISKECHKDIIDLVEEYINEAIPSIVDKPGKNMGSKAFRQDWARVMKAREGNDLKVTSTKPKPTGLQTAKATLRNVKKSIKKEGITPEKQQKAKELASQVTELTNKRKRESGSPFTVMYTTEELNTLCEALLDLVKPKKKKEISPKMLELRDRILKANKRKEPPKQQKEKIEVPKVTVQGVFGEAVELAEAVIHEVSKELAESLIDEAISILEKITVSQVKQGAKNSIPTRKAQEEKASSNLGEVIYPFRGAVYDPKNKRANAWDEAAYRLYRAERLAKILPNSNRSGAELKATAKRVASSRSKENEVAFNNLQNTSKEFFSKHPTERTNSDYDTLKKAHKDYWKKQNREDEAHLIIGKKLRRPEKDSSGNYELKDQGFIDRSEG